MSTESLKSPQKEGFLLVTFQYGDPAAPSFAYYTNRSEDYAEFMATPTLAVDLPPNIAELRDQGVAKFKMPRDAFVERLTDGLPTAPTLVKVEEMTLPVKTEDSGKRLVLFVGKVTSTVRNVGNRSGTREIRARSWKSLLDIRMGYTVDSDCPFIFDGLGCNSGTVSGGSPVGSRTAAGTVLAVDGNKLTFSASLSAFRQHHYSRGYAVKDGIKIDIREFDSAVDDTVVYLTRPPPTNWLGASVQLFAGCRKTIDDCREWTNEANYGGVGTGIPAYNPDIEVPPT
jgi:hypothetical protein